jgi:hypothetical protein
MTVTYTCPSGERSIEVDDTKPLADQRSIVLNHMFANSAEVEEVLRVLKVYKLDDDKQTINESVNDLLSDPQRVANWLSLIAIESTKEQRRDLIYGIGLEVVAEDLLPHVVQMLSIKRRQELIETFVRRGNFAAAARRAQKMSQQTDTPPAGPAPVV